MSGGMKSGVSVFNILTVVRARCAGGLSCWNVYRSHDEYLLAMSYERQYCNNIPHWFWLSLVGCLSSSVNGIFTDVTMTSSLCTPVISMQEKCLITHFLDPLGLWVPNITKVATQFSEIYEKQVTSFFQTQYSGMVSYNKSYIVALLCLYTVSQKSLPFDFLNN